MNANSIKTTGLLLMLCFLVSFVKVTAQETRYFGNFSGYAVSNDFKKGTVFEAGGGIEVELNALIKPEVSLSYTFMGINDQRTYDYVNNWTEIVRKNASSINLTFSPKIYFWFHDGEEDGLQYSWFIAPKFSMSRIMASESYTGTNNINIIYDKNRISDWQHALGFALGCEMPVSENNSSLVISINLSKLNFGKTLNRFPHNQIDYSTIAAGASLMFYFK